MPVSEKTKKEAAKARGWLSKILPRKKKKTPFNQGMLGKASDSIRSRRAEQERALKGY